MKPINQYYCGGDNTGELICKEYYNYDLFEFTDYKTMQVYQKEAIFKNGKMFRKIENKWNKVV
jgi:hypothetical protein